MHDNNNSKEPASDLEKSIWAVIDSQGVRVSDVTYARAKAEIADLGEGSSATIVTAESVRRVRHYMDFQV